MIIKIIFTECRENVPFFICLLCVYMGTLPPVSYFRQPLFRLQTPKTTMLRWLNDIKIIVVILLPFFFPIWMGYFSITMASSITVVTTDGDFKDWLVNSITHYKINLYKIIRLKCYFSNFYYDAMDNIFLLVLNFKSFICLRIISRTLILKSTIFWNF